MSGEIIVMCYGVSCCVYVCCVAWLGECYCKYTNFFIVGYFYTDCNIRWVLALFYKMFNKDSVMIDYD